MYKELHFPVFFVILEMMVVDGASYEYQYQQQQNPQQEAYVSYYSQQPQLQLQPHQNIANNYVVNGYNSQGYDKAEKYAYEKKYEYENEYKSYSIEPVPLYRYYNLETVDHFYSIVKELKDGENQYTFLGIAGYVFPAGDYEIVPCHRFFNENATDHFYTTQAGEVMPNLQNLYTPEGVAWYMYSKPYPGAIPLFRYFNALQCDHAYTTSWKEFGGGTDKYTYEGIAGYIFPNREYY